MDVIITAQEIIDWYNILYEKELVDSMPFYISFFDYKLGSYYMRYNYMKHSFYCFQHIVLPLRVMIPFNGTFIPVVNYLSLMIGQVDANKANQMLAIPITFSEAVVVLARPVPWDHELLMALFFIFIYGAIAGGDADLYNAEVSAAEQIIDDLRAEID